MSDLRVEPDKRGGGDDEPDETRAGNATERPADKLDEGDVIAGKYRIEKVIGKGGMGIVLKARHLTLDEPVAIKVLLPELMNSAGMVTRFLREARAASKIKSDHVVRVTDVDTLPSGTPYMVMEYLEGTDLLALRRKKGSAFEIEEAVGYVVEACDAIAEAHAIGIVHRDLKPGNLFLASRRDGRAILKVLDFGISKVDNPNEHDTTRTGQLMGSPKYMSPEQMLGLKTVDGRADIWALGVILYEFFTRRPPFSAESMPQLCTKILHTAPDRPSEHRPELPKELEEIVLRCLEKEPDNRFASVGELMQALLPFTPVQSIPPSNLVAFSRSSRTSSAALMLDGRGREPTPASVSAPALTAQSHVSSQAPGSSGTAVGWDAAASSGEQPAKKRSRAWIFGSGAAALLLGGAAAFIANQDGSQAGRPATTSADTPPSTKNTAPSIDVVPVATTATASADVAPPSSADVTPPSSADVTPPSSADVISPPSTAPVVKPAGAPAGSAIAPKPVPPPHKQVAPAQNGKPVPFDPFGGSRN